MVSIKRGLNKLATSRALFFDSIVKNFLRFLPDKLYLSLRYRCIMGRWIAWNSPRTFTEKIQWLKIYNRRSEFIKMVDKHAVKEYVANIIGSDYIIPTIAVWNNPNEIEWEKLPEQFVLKTTHGGGGQGIVICKDKSTFDTSKAINTLNEALAIDIYKSFREWPYKDVPKKVIAEKYIVASNNDSKSQLYDYKFFCFNGKVKFFKVDFDRFIEHHANYYTPEGTLLDFGEVGLEPDFNAKLHMPYNLNDMIILAEKLAGDIPFLRVDFYNVNGDVYFGELTFYPASGMGKWTKDDADLLIGGYLNISNLMNIG